MFKLKISSSLNSWLTKRIDKWWMRLWWWNRRKLLSLLESQNWIKKIFSNKIKIINFRRKKNREIFNIRNHRSLSTWKALFLWTLSDWILWKEDTRKWEEWAVWVPGVWEFRIKHSEIKSLEEGLFLFYFCADKLLKKFFLIEGF